MKHLLSTGTRIDGKWNVKTSPYIDVLNLRLAELEDEAMYLFGKIYECQVRQQIVRAKQAQVSNGR